MIKKKSETIFYLILDFINGLESDESSNMLIKGKGIILSFYSNSFIL